MADPVCRVPQRDERVAATDGEVATCRSERDGHAGGGVCVESVGDVEGGVLHDFDGAFACCCEEVEVWGVVGCDVVGEGGGICLDGLGV